MPDITLSITIPESKQAQVIEAWTAEAGEEGFLTFGTEDSFLAHIRFTIPAYDSGSETLPQFGQRFLRALGVASVKAYGEKQRIDADQTDIDALTKHTNQVPDDVLT